MTERHPKICLISPTEDLARRAKKLVARRGMDVRVEVAELEAAVSLARRLLAEDDYLFISRRGTRDLLRKSLKIQVVNIPGVGLYSCHSAVAGRAGPDCVLFL